MQADNKMIAPKFEDRKISTKFNVILVHARATLRVLVKMFRVDAKQAGDILAESSYAIHTGKSSDFDVMKNQIDAEWKRLGGAYGRLERSQWKEWITTVTRWELPLLVRKLGVFSEIPSVRAYINILETTIDAARLYK